MIPDQTAFTQGATHTCIVGSSPPEAIYLPSGDQAITRTAAVCWKENSLRLVIVSHTCTVPSSLAKAKRFARTLLRHAYTHYPNKFRDINDVLLGNTEKLTSNVTACMFAEDEEEMKSLQVVKVTNNPERNKKVTN